MTCLWEYFKGDDKMEKVNKVCMCYTAKVIPLAFDESMSYY